MTIAITYCGAHPGVNIRGVMSNPKNLTKVSLVGLILLLSVEFIAINLAGSRLPSQIDPNDSRPMLQSLVAFDGVLLGFAAVVFNSLMNRESTFDRVSYLMTSMFVTVILFLVSVAASFFALAEVSASSGLQSSSFIQPLGFMVYGTSVLFFTIYIHVARSKQAFR